MSADLLLASQNPGKLNEMKQLVEGTALPRRGAAGARDPGGPEGDGDDVSSRTRPSRRSTTRARSGLLSVADDSGLSVDALDGGPGLYSSRFGGEGATDGDRNRLLLEKLAGVPEERRGAHFTSAVVVARGDTTLFQAQETVDGLIAERPHGTSGFGYDPLFYYPPFGQDVW